VLTRAVRRFFGRLGIGVTSAAHLQDLVEKSRLSADVAFILSFSDRQAAQLLRALPNSKSQLRQDLFALSALDFKKNGYFVEFGAADGIVDSNTFLLEKDFGWSGILAEPAKHWHSRLQQNRSCHVEMDCVWHETGASLTFNESPSAVHSTIDSFSSSGMHSHWRRNGDIYTVKTISLTDLLEKYDSPAVIDYLSIDTEGSEFDILMSHDFARYRFRVITCEHNFLPARENILNLLTGKGYMRVLTNLSMFDDWYVDAPLADHFMQLHTPSSG
jgi:FkbM family methyltransferase